MTSSATQGFRPSSQQRRIWSLSREERAPVGFAVLRIDGEPDRERLRRAVRSLAARHEALRTRFARRQGTRYPLQVIAQRIEPRWDEAELPEGVSDGAPEAAAREAEDLVGGDESGDDPLFGVRLLSGTGDSHLLVIGASALIADARSLDNLSLELPALYEGDGAESALDEPVQYADFTAWQEELQEDEEPEAERGRRFWSASGATGDRPEAEACELLLPGEVLPEVPDRHRRPGTLGVRLGAEDRFRVADAARRAGCDPADLVLACFVAWLARLSGQERIPLTVVADGRPFDELVTACGSFAIPLPIELAVPGSATAESLVEPVRRTVREASDHAHYFDWEARGSRSAGIGFEVGRRPPARAARGVGFRQVWKESPALGLKLRLEVLDDGDGLLLTLTFDRDRFVDPDARRFLEQIATLVTSAAAAPGAPLRTLPLLGPSEREELLGRHGGGVGGAWVSGTIHERIVSRAAQSPQAPAVASEDTGLSYGELEEQANRLSHLLRDRGLITGQPVALVLERSADAVVAMVAVLKAGGAFCFLDATQPAARRGSMLRELGAPLAIVRGAEGDGAAELLAGHGGAVVDLDRDGDALRGRPAVPPAVRVPSESLAYVVFTSGSTGRPKGVGVEHRHLLAYLDGVVPRLDLDAVGSFGCVATFGADLGYTVVFAALTGGATLHVISPDEATDTEVLARRLRGAGVECLKIVPSHLRALLAAGPAEGALPVQRLILGGEALDRDLVDRVRSHSSAVRIDNHYGPTETTVGVLTHRADRDMDGRLATVPVGRPLSGTRVYVVGADLELVPFWTAGELVVGGWSVSRGYLGRPGLTAERFVPDPFGADPGSRLYRTGDLVRRVTDGSIEFLGRADRQVKYHGFRVELDEIGRALERHPGVREAWVRLCRDGAEREVLVAYYAAPRELPPAELRSTAAEIVLKETLPAVYHRVEALPRASSGKVDLGALPGLEEIHRTGHRDAPRNQTPAEELVADVWADLLGLERVGAGDHFFDLGGHSLLATQAISRLRRIFDVELEVRALFEEPTLAGLVRRIEAAGRPGTAGGARPEIPSRDGDPGDLPLSYAQERIWATQRLDPDDPSYNSIRAYTLSGDLHLRALARSLGDLTCRHEALRTTFLPVEGRGRQVIHGWMAPDVAVVDLSGLAPRTRERQTLELTELELRTAFDLTRGPLLRVRILLQEAREATAVFTMHHIVGDAWSRGIFIRELMACYRDRRDGMQPRLALLPLQYGDFAVWQRRWMEAGGAEDDLAFWRRRLAGAPERFELPTDLPRPTHRTSAGGTVRSELPPDLVRTLKATGREAGTTLFMTLLAAFDLLLHRATGREDVVVGSDVAGRRSPELEGIVGLFVNHVVLRADLAGNPTFRELLQRVREVTLEAYAHQDLPFDRLVHALRPRRDPGRTPLFQILFVLQNVPMTDLELAGVRVTPLELDPERTKFDLAVFAEEREEGLGITWSYRSDLFRLRTVEDLAARFARLLEDGCRRPDLPIAELDGLDAEARELEQERRADRDRSRIRRLETRRRSGPSRGGAGGMGAAMKEEAADG